MKMQSFRKPKRALSPLQTLALIAAGLVLLVLLVLRVFFPGSLLVLASPVWSLGSTLTQLFGGEGYEDASRAQIEELMETVAQLQNENRALRAKGIDALHEEGGVTAGVLARPPLTPYDVLVIDAGAAEGIQDGMYVAHRGIPVGIIESVTEHGARVVLYSATNRATDGWIGDNRIPVTLAGAGAGAFYAEVPREAEIQEGDMVYLAGHSTSAIGVVVRIERDPASPRASLAIRPFANPFTMNSVTVDTTRLP